MLLPPTLLSRIATVVLLACSAPHALGAPSSASGPSASAREAHSVPSLPSAQALPPQALDPVLQRIVLNSTAVYDVLAGEMYVQSRQPGAGFAYLMDGARRTGDARIYARATEVAIRARAADAALKAVQAWKAAAPDDFEADSHELQIFLALGRLDQTAEPLSQALSKAPTDKKLELIHALPALYSKSKDPALALQIVGKALQPALRDSRTQFIAATSLARMQLAARQYPQALASLRKTYGAVVPPEKTGSALPNRELPALVALDLMRIKRSEDAQTPVQAEAFVREALRNTKSSAELHISYARVLTEQKRYEDASVQMRQMLQLHPAYAPGWLLQGGLLGQLRQWQPAEAALQRYLALRSAEENQSKSAEERSMVQLIQSASTASSDIQAYMMLAEIADARNEPEAATNWIRRIPSPAARQKAMLQRVEQLGRKGRIEQALTLAGELPSATSKDRILRALLESQLQEQAGRLTTAESILDKALGDDSEDTELLYARGMLRGKLDKTAQAEADLRRVIALKPESAAAYNALGYMLADRTLKLQQARTLVAKALQLEPDNGAIQDSMGWVEYRLGNLPQARHWLEKAFSTEPQPEVAAHLGEVLWKMGHTAEARDIWQKGLRMDAKDKVLLETIQRIDRKTP